MTHVHCFVFLKARPNIGNKGLIASVKHFHNRRGKNDEWEGGMAGEKIEYTYI